MSAHAGHSAHGWEVRCAQCGELRWPYLPEQPDRYVCVRCCAGAGAGVREARLQAGRLGAARRSMGKLQEPGERPGRTGGAA